MYGDGVRLEMLPSLPGWRMITPTGKVLLGVGAISVPRALGSTLFPGVFYWLRYHRQG